MIKVNSSVISAIAFKDGEGLTVEFKSGAKYLYPNATKLHFVDFLKAPSKGKYFSANVRKLKSTKL